MEETRLPEQPNKKRPARRKRAVLASGARAKSSAPAKTAWRRRVPQRVTYLFDQAVPESVLFRGIGLSKGSRPQPRVRVTEEPELSQFTIHLQAELPTPQEILAERERAPVRLNLLVSEKELLSDPAFSSRTLNAMSVAKDEVLGQLTENDRTAESSREPVRTSPRAIVPAPKFDLDTQPALPTWQAVREAILAFREQKPTRPITAEIFSIEELVPPAPDLQPVAETELAEETTAEAFVCDLVLPESDETSEEESELVTFDDLAAGFEATDNAAPARHESAFGFFRKICLPSLRLPRLSFARIEFELPQGWQRTLAAFVLFAFAFVLPLQAMGALQDLRTARGLIESSGLSGLARLEAGASSVLSKNASDAASEFAAAGRAFTTAQDTLDELGGAVDLLLSALPETRGDYTLGKKLVDVGQDVSLAGQRLSEGFLAIDHEAATTLTSKISILAAYIASAQPSLSHAAETLRSIDAEDVPEEQRPLFIELQDGVKGLSTSLGDIQSFSETMLPILGDDGEKRYLLVFQNNTELRPTGGFMGSFALIDVKDGEIVGLDIPEGGTYDLQGSLLTSRVAPGPLRLLNARWEFQDANWFADFPTSARQILEFYEDSGGPSVDGVIAVNATFVSSLLDILGPVAMPDYGRVMDSENFIFETQKIVETEYETYADPESDRDEPAPKAFIGDMAVEMLDMLSDASLETFLGVLDRMNQGLATKDIQLYFADNDMQRTVRERNWDGRVKTADGDYLMVVDTNLGGGKTDGVISETVDVDVAIGQDGSIVNTVTVERTHRGISQTLFTGVNNVDYIRLYVPQGSTLLAASGFSIPDESLFEQPDAAWTEDEDVRDVEAFATVDAISGTTIADEFGKTVFGNWIQTKPGTTSTVTFTYRLPFNVDALTADPGFIQKIKASLGWRPTDTYTLTIQKQAGVLDRTTTVSVDYPDDLAPLWTSATDGNVFFTNETDSLYAILFERDV